MTEYELLIACLIASLRSRYCCVWPELGVAPPSRYTFALVGVRVRVRARARAMARARARVASVVSEA